MTARLDPYPSVQHGWVVEEHSDGRLVATHIMSRLSNRVEPYWDGDSRSYREYTSVVKLKEARTNELAQPISAPMLTVDAHALVYEVIWADHKAPS